MQKAGPHHETGPHENDAATSEDTASSGRRDRRSRVAQYPPHGPIPTNARLLVSALLWADTESILSTGKIVYPGDLDEPHRTLYAALLDCAHAGKAGPRLILDRLMRDGDASQPVRDELVHATTAGGRPELLRDYAAAVLADRFRAACESYGQGVLGWVATGSESELWHGITSHGTELRKLADRLTAARGGEL